MNRFVMLVAAGMVVLDVFAPVVRAQNYVVNGHVATEAEAQLLTSYSAPGGEWRVDGYGIARVADEHAARVVQVASPKCWYVLDVKLCD
jgi:hypothetical protein